MTTIALRPGSWLALLRVSLGGLLIALLAACGGSNADLPPPTGPSLTHPTDQSTPIGGDATFAVDVAGGTATAFQWQRSAGGGAWNEIAGATGATLVVAGATLAESGTQYRAVVTVAGATLISNPAVLTVTPLAVAPAIVAQPADQSVIEPATATFNVTASGTGPLAYQWQRLGGGTWTNVAGATAASHVTPATARVADDGAQFRVVISNAVGSVTSNAATLGVGAASLAPVFVTSPANATVVAPATASFTVVVSGTPAPTLQWQLSTDAGTTWSDVAGATATTYTTPATTTAMSGHRYRALASNGVGPVVASGSALLTVNAAATAPGIATQPANQTVTEPAAATFSASASGSGPLAYQWQRLVGGTWNNITGATAAAYTTPATVRAADNGAQFRVVVTNAVASATSNAATLTVLSATTAKSWGTPQLLRTDGDDTNTTAELAMDGSGNALVVWGQEFSSSLSRVDIWSNRFTVGAGWGTAQVIESNDLSSTSNSQPFVAADAAGNALVVWYQSSGSGSFNSIWANRYTAGAGWGTPELIETGNAGSAYSPNVAVDRNGNGLAVWAQSNGVRYSLWANRYTVGAGWGTAELIETDEAGDVAWFASPPSIAFDPSGRAIVVWQQSDGTRDNIWANRYTPGVGWGTAELIETDNAGRARFPQVAVDAAGNALAVWAQSDGTRDDIWANRYVVGTGWGTPQRIETGDGGASDAQVAFDASGKAMATWTQRDTTTNRDTVRFNRYTAGTGWGVAALVASSPVGSVNSARFVFDADGGALAVWGTTDGTNNIVQFGRYTVAGGWTAVSSAGGSSAQAVLGRIAIDANGNAVAVWLQNAAVAGNSGVFRVWGARYQ
ncbi:MAG: immunoglobulin domain-containing protein [Burkholderiales bacterium]|nr:immunoglobulin domain-containing protein [Burkholderiales bacterium]